MVHSGHSNYSIKQRENERYVFVCVFFKNSSNCQEGRGWFHTQSLMMKMYRRQGS